jgi:hypothetical protein
MIKTVEKSDLIPYPIIVSATHGDADSIKVVIKHFEGYIKELSTRHLYDDDGNCIIYVDEGLKSRLENKLICALLTTFDAVA